MVKLNKKEITDVKTLDTFDILKPKFSISKTNENIDITADQGNFIDENNILLKNNVKFKSKDFEIFADDVIFDKKKETAISSKDSIFVSNKTKIRSEGFNITQGGSIIEFYGKTSLTSSK